MQNGDGVPCKIQLECHTDSTDVINKLWQLNVCCKTYCSTTIQQLNTESKKNCCTDWSTQFLNTNHGKYLTYAWT